MSGILATVEDAIVARAKTALGFPAAPVVKVIDTLPGGWTLDMLRRALQMSPGVYVAFLGGQSTSNGGYLDGRFAVYGVTKGAREEDRRRGNAREIGAYDIVELLATQLDDLDVPDVGTLAVRSVENVFSEAMFELGGTVYALTLSLPNLPWPIKDTTTLAPFVTFDAVHSMAPGADEPAHETLVTLSQ